MLQNHVDIITSFEVIEHINNPLEEITNFQKLLCKGGIAYITTPNINVLERYIFGPKYDNLAYPKHLNWTLAIFRN